MKSKLAVQAFIKFAAGLIIASLLLFLPAGTLCYPGAWLFIGVLFIPMIIIGVFLLVKDPALLERRLNSKEKESTQKGVVLVSLLMFISGFVAAALDFRFSLLPLPKGVSIAAAIVFLAGYGMYAEVLRENTYLSRTVEVSEGQKVIDTGLYGIMRHPMYTATILMFLSMPLILGSLISFFIFLIYPVVIITRIGNEEKVLEEGLEGYTEYKQKVRYRLIPKIW